MLDRFSPRADDPGQRHQQLPEDGKGSLRLLAIMIGAVGVLAVVSML